MLRINGLTIHAYHGVMPHEGKVGQTFRLDVLVELGRASHDATIRGTVSHREIVMIVRKAFCARAYRLVEAAAGAVAEALLQSSSRIQAVRIVVHKPQAPITATFSDVGVSIRRVRVS